VSGINKGVDWYKNISGVISICIMNFETADTKFRTNYRLIDDTDLGRKLEGFCIISLQIPRISNTFENCKTAEEKWLFLFKNINTMEKATLSELKGNLQEVVNLAELSAMSKDEQLRYFAAENKERAYWDSIGTAESKGMAKGIKKGREEGIEATATALKGKNIDIELIAQCTGLTVEQVKKL
ncbi:MAG: PD-(D/E)XK nuclease family transposase, partial [Bacteroidales bacterium]